MFITIDLDSKTPIYEQIENQIILGISQGHLSSGQVLPSVRSLGSDLGVNFHTVNKAYKSLEARGYLRIDRSAGTRVQENIPKFSPEAEKETLDIIKLTLAEYSIRGYSDKETLNKIENLLREVKND